MYGLISFTGSNKLIMFRKKSWRWIGIVIVVITALLMMRLSGCIGDVGDIVVSVDTVTEKNIIETVLANGKIYPEMEVKIKPDVSGEVVELTVEEGDSVIQGQILLKINPSIYQAAVTQAKASMEQSRAGVANAQKMLSQSQAQLDRAEMNFNRNKQLFQNKVISKFEFEQYETEYLSAKANRDAIKANIDGGNYGIESANAHLSQALENLRRTTITAPVSGVISQLLVKQGERVVGTAQMDGTQILTIADMDKMELRVDISETDISRVSIGDTSIIEVDAYRKEQFKGIVTRIAVSSTLLNTGLGSSAANSADQVTNYTVHILILKNSYKHLQERQNNKSPFKPGMSASVEIITQQKNNILAVPINAVTIRENENTEENNKDKFKQVVFFYDATTKTVQSREVKTGIQDAEYIEIAEGIKKNDIIISAPYSIISRTLQDGTKVIVKNKSQLYESGK